MIDDMLRDPDTDPRSLTAHDAANLLHVTPATLGAWEQEFGFPASVRSEHPTRNYLITDLLALQEALADALSITSAIHTARLRIAHTPRPASGTVGAGDS